MAVVGGLDGELHAAYLACALLGLVVLNLNVPGQFGVEHAAQAADPAGVVLPPLHSLRHVLRVPSHDMLLELLRTVPGFSAVLAGGRLVIVQHVALYLVARPNKVTEVALGVHVVLVPVYEQNVELLFAEGSPSELAVTLEVGNLVVLFVSREPGPVVAGSQRKDLTTYWTLLSRDILPFLLLFQTGIGQTVLESSVFKPELVNALEEFFDAVFWRVKACSFPKNCNIEE